MKGKRREDQKVQKKADQKADLLGTQKEWR